jgi:hypothetical protein
LIAVLPSLAQVAFADVPPSAAPSPSRAQLSVVADPSCATRARVVEQVHARSPRIVFVEHEGDIPSLEVTIGGPPEADRVATLVVTWPDGRRSERRLTAASCTAALQALALLVAMTLDPGSVDSQAAPSAAPAGRDGVDEGSGTAPGAAPETGEAESTSEASADGTADPAAVRTPPPSTNEGPARTARAAETPVDAHAPHPLGVAHVAAGASAQLSSGPAPSVMPGMGVYARLSMNGAGLWAPAVQLQLTHLWASGLEQSDGDASFTLQSAALDLCPLGLTLPPLAAHACFASSLGRLTARGSRTYAPQTHGELWSSLGGRALLSVGLGGLVELQGGLGLTAPLRRYGFAFRPDVFHRVSRVCVEGHLGAGVRFP